MDWLIGLDDKERTRLEESGGNKYNPEFAVSCTGGSSQDIPIGKCGREGEECP